MKHIVYMPNKKFTKVKDKIIEDINGALKLV